MSSRDLGRPCGVCVELPEELIDLGQMGRESLLEVRLELFEPCMKLIELRSIFQQRRSRAHIGRSHGLTSWNKVDNILFRTITTEI
jgi:hypothetical protein